MTADLTRGSTPDAAHWTLDDLQLDRIERDKVRDDELIYALVTAASFVETAAELYTSNLVLHFPDPRARAWLANRWRLEELQHGRALRAYVETAWPELDWRQGYRGFFDEYSRLCTMDELEASRALEMAARCVVETGTATFYTSLHACAREPVLKRLTGFIRRDEVRHYNYFRSFYQDYQAEERVGRLGVLRALRKRFTEAEQEDAYIGFRHAWLMRHPGQAFHDEYFTEFMRQVRAVFALHYPYRMMIQMLLQPLDLNRTVQKLAIPLLARGARRLMFH
jgi:rubrerythrin